MVTSLSHKISIDENASHGAWVRDLGTGQEFLDFSGDWAGWALGHGLRGYSWADFVDELLSHRERKLHFQWGGQPSFDCSLRDAAMGWIPLLPQSSEAHITAALSEEGVHLIGPLGDQAPPCIAPSWVQSLRETAAVHEKSLLLNDTKSLFGGNGGLGLANEFGGGLAGSIVFLSDTTYLEFRRHELDCDIDTDDSFNVADLVSGKFSKRSDEELHELEAYFRRVFTEIVEDVAGLNLVGTRGLSLWCETSSGDLAEEISSASFNEGLLIGRDGHRGLAFHVPPQVKADAIGRAAAQFEAGLSSAMEKMNRWLK